MLVEFLVTDKFLQSQELPVNFLKFRSRVFLLQIPTASTVVTTMLTTAEASSTYQFATAEPTSVAVTKSTVSPLVA